MKRLLELWKKYNPFDIEEYYHSLQSSIITVGSRLESMDSKIDNEVKKLTLELNLYKSMISTIGDTIPDMMWLKDLDGKYLYANKAIKTKLLFDMNPIGKTDRQLSEQAKKHFGEENHTFGEKCKNSDVIVIETEKPQRFLESGKLQGKMTYLEVFKAPVYIDNKLIGICGTGRDMTEYVEAYRENACGKCPSMNDIFTKYEFTDEDSKLVSERVYNGL